MASAYKFLIILSFTSVLVHCASPEQKETRNAVAETLNKQSAHFQECGELSEARNSEAPEGRIILSWDIDSTGFPKKITIADNSTEDKTLAECLKNKVENIKFPTSDIVKEYRVQFPFVFKN